MKNILVLDDNEILLNAIATWLNRQIPEYQIMLGSNGREGIEILKRYPVDLILTDLNMPVMNGIMFIQKKNSLCPDTPVIAMTSFPSYETIEKLKTLGITQILEKPFEFDLLTDTILKALDDRKLCEVVPA